jgi:RNA 3'-terminal phosphate cyclase (ATP)
MIELEAEHVTEVFTAFGQLGVRAEGVAKEALRQAEEYLAAGVPVGRHLADQIMLPLGIGAYLGAGGGVFRTMELSLHSTTYLEILRRFLEITAQVKQRGSDDWLMGIG